MQAAEVVVMDWEHVLDWVVDRRAEGMAVDGHWARDWPLERVHWVATNVVMVQRTKIK